MHTPGPWQVSDGPDIDGDPYETVFAKDRPVIAHVGEWDGEGESNARLIAAAPDLLEALRDLLDQLRGIGIPDWHGAEGLTLEQADTAVAKARSQE
jgi:hypothetical protein